MRQILGIFAVLIAFFCLAGTGAAQGTRSAFPLDSGRDVRVTTLAERMTGRLQAPFSRNDQTLRFCAGAAAECAARSIPTNDLLRLEVRRGSHAKAGAIIGGIAGAVVGGFFGYLITGFCDAADCPSTGQGLVVGGLIGGASGGATGGLIGALVPRWGAPEWVH